MNLSDIKTLYNYNSWANNRLMNVLETLNEEQFTKDLSSSHGGVQGTLAHILASHEMWLSRWQGSPKKTTIDEEKPTFLTAKQFWNDMQQKFSSFIVGLSDADLQKSISYTNTKGESYTTPLWQMMLQVVTHAMYHRGQIVTMLRQLGVKPVNTDIIFYFRQK